jgi:hypothetical protein
MVNRPPLQGVCPASLTPQGELTNLALISWAKEAVMADILIALANGQRGICL